MTTLQAEVFEAFRPIDVAEDEALKPASAWSRHDSKGSALQADRNVMKWMTVSVPGLKIAIFAKLFVH